ncbi:MAG: undecaprenyl-diphosphate phosphatase [Clostridia bacterium]|nr:undecaprenyl-diphosphate phosphatase [Clostridia bacterium]MBR3255743.1 undecaprenyl-diphosphate phosphatase [Clostridia bacterium]
MTIFQAIILGIVQGVTELLPISSSAHLNLIPWMCGWNVTESFDVALHFGTLIAICLFFYNDWIELIKEGMKIFKCKSKKNVHLSKEGKMFWLIAIATIPGGVIGFLLDHFIGEKLANMPILIAIMLIVMGVILYLVDKYAPTKNEYENMSFKQSFLIGLSQALAFIPGVSRSGITMTTGRMLGVSREGAAKYSFMLSTPIVLGATLYKFKDFGFDIPFLVGVITSAISGILVIKFLLDYLKKGDFKVFAVYRVLLGLAVIWLYICR